MKDFKQFNKEVNEAAALVTALPKIAGIATKVAPKLPKIAKFASGALKFGTAIPVGLGIGNMLQSKKDDQSKSNDGPFSPMSDFGASLSRSKYGKGGPQKKPEGQLSNLEIIRQELQKRLKRGAEGKFRRGHSGKFQQSDADLKNKIKEIDDKLGK